MKLEPLNSVVRVFSKFKTLIEENVFHNCDPYLKRGVFFLTYNPICMEHAFVERKTLNWSGFWQNLILNFQKDWFSVLK